MDIVSWERRRNRKSFGGQGGAEIVPSGFHLFHLRSGGLSRNDPRGKEKIALEEMAGTNWNLLHLGFDRAK